MRFFVPNTNVSLSGTLKDGGAFTGVSVTSLNCYGTCHRFPRVTSNISINSHFRNRCFVRFCCIHGNSFSGGVAMDDPITIISTSSIPTGICLVFDTSVQTTISLSTIGQVGTQFVAWRNESGNTLSTSQSATLSLTNATVANSQRIIAVWEEAQGSAS